MAEFVTTTTNASTNVGEIIVDEFYSSPPVPLVEPGAEFVEPGVQAGVTMSPAALAIQVRTLSKQLAHVVGSAPMSSQYHEDDEDGDEDGDGDEYQFNPDNPYDPETGVFWSDVERYFDQAQEHNNRIYETTHPANGRTASVIHAELKEAIRLRRSTDGQRLLAEMVSLTEKIRVDQQKIIQYGFAYSELTVRNIVRLFMNHSAPEKTINPQIKGLAESIYKYAQGLPTIENPPLGMEANFIRSIVALAKIYYGTDLEKGVEALPDVIGDLIKWSQEYKGSSQVMEVEDAQS